MKKRTQIKTEIDEVQELLTKLVTASRIKNDKDTKILLKTLKTIFAQYQDKLAVLKKENEELILDLKNVCDIKPLEIWNILENIHLLDKSLQFPQPTTLKMQTANGLTEEITLSPQYIIAITNHPDYPKGRRKALYTIELNQTDKKIVTYYMNNDIYTFEYLIHKLDPLNHYLLHVSKNAIVNVEFYEIGRNNMLTLNLNSKIKHIEKIQGSKEKPFNVKEDFSKIKDLVHRRFSFQKQKGYYRELFDL